MCILGVVNSRSLLQLQVLSIALVTATGHAVYQIECCIRGYHVYHRIWHPIIGEVLGTTCERENEHDRYTVAVLEEETCCVVGHFPRLISHECYFFLRTGGTITAEVTGRRRCSDLRYPNCRRPCTPLLRFYDTSQLCITNPNYVTARAVRQS